jgi:hypothetical protein
MRKTIFIVVVLLASCVLASDIRESGPRFELTSGRPAKTVALCISDHWKNTTLSAGIPITMQVTSDGYAVAAAVNNIIQRWTGMLSEVSDTPSGSTTRYYTIGMLGTASYDIVVKDCQ